MPGLNFIHKLKDHEEITMTDKDLELNVEEFDDVTGGSGLGIADIPIKDLVELLKLYPGIDALKDMVKNNVQEAINWAVENLPGYLYEKYSEYTLAELKDYVAKYAQRAIQILAKM